MTAKITFLLAAFMTMTSTPLCEAFVPTSRTMKSASPIFKSSPSSLPMMSMMMDPIIQMSTDASITTATTIASSSSSSLVESLSSTLLSFSDQGQNLAGIFFQASLLPYLAFLYFLTFRGNRTPELGGFGWQFLLVFVLSTIPSGIISKATYGCSLADVDWLHGGAEALLTITNVLIVLGWRRAMHTESEQDDDASSSSSKGGAFNLKNSLVPVDWKPKGVAFGTAALFALTCVSGPGLFQAHSAFLFGLGNLPSDFVTNLPWVIHSEPVNALSIPTWAIHFSSVFEFLFAMDIIWNYAETTGNEKWKGMTWGMLPLHASGVAACTYHFFYNPSSLQFLVSTQAGLTLLGNITVAIAAYRIALSNGWSLSELNPLPRSSTSPSGVVVDQAAALPLAITPAKETDAQLAIKLSTLTFFTAYLVKYGELGLDIPFEANGYAAVAILAGIPALTALNFYNKQQLETGQGGFELNLPSLPSFGGNGDAKPSLSMTDVKKYGVAGTVAYVLTELAFWAVAFPVASTALYQSTGHWPDVIHDSTDRTTVLGFIFAGANVARLLVPLRLGAALALAPWVDENLINKKGTAATTTTTTKPEQKGTTESTTSS
eukprot:CAMPEP_0184862384 /NCGR_PEP_ID=MMETSP0580-20130426/6855_1 /TAXON_ID=1118495 /ORGANISM="Dactyliosolen fragilissimus" /LENGTH=603 /DNA_ID=CAMNT_0027360229 /DNA_START=47 /DNA_END=1858 /DNA_ORIENTATION=-